MHRKGFTVVELMVGLIIMSLILTAIWHVYSASRKNAKEILENHVINDELDKTLIRITNDIREANSIASYPPVLTESQIEELTTTESDPIDESENKLQLIKLNYDFSRKPDEIPDDEVNYSTNDITYYVVPCEDVPGKWNLRRFMVYINEKKYVEEKKDYEVLHAIDECIFYKKEDPDAVRQGNTYIKIKIGHTESDKYSNECVISVKERGAMPE